MREITLEEYKKIKESLDWVPLHIYCLDVEIEHGEVGKINGERVKIPYPKPVKQHV